MSADVKVNVIAYHLTSSRLIPQHAIHLFSNSSAEESIRLFPADGDVLKVASHLPPIIHVTVSLQSEFKDPYIHENNSISLQVPRQ